MLNAAQLNINNSNVSNNQIAGKFDSCLINKLTSLNLDNANVKAQRI